MATVKELKATARPKAGKGAARAERRAGRVPAVIYGDNQAPLTISLDDKGARQAIFAGAKPASRIADTAPSIQEWIRSSCRMAVSSSAIPRAFWYSA